MPKTAVVILNWNGQKLLEKFLPIVIKNSEHPDVEIIVADNASTDNSISFLKEFFPSVRIIELDLNYGFAGGYNKALKQVDAEYFLLLNSDVAPEPDWLEPLISELNNNSNTGACMPKIRAYNDPEMFEYAGAAGGYIDWLGYPFCRGRILNKIEKDKGQYNEPTPVFWATGAALMIRSELYKKTDGLDESFFAHMEEIDLCWQIKNMGYNIMAIPSSEVLHVGGATLNQQHPKKTYLNFRNNMLMMVKNLPANKLFITLLIRTIMDGIAGIHFILKGEFNHFFAVIKAHGNYYKLLPQALRKRKAIGKTRIITNHTEIYPQSIIWAYYFNNLRKFSQLKHFNFKS